MRAQDLQRSPARRRARRGDVAVAGGLCLVLGLAGLASVRVALAADTGKVVSHITQRHLRALIDGLHERRNLEFGRGGIGNFTLRRPALHLGLNWLRGIKFSRNVISRNEALGKVIALVRRVECAPEAPHPVIADKPFNETIQRQLYHTARAIAATPEAVTTVGDPSRDAPYEPDNVTKKGGLGSSGSGLAWVIKGLVSGKFLEAQTAKGLRLPSTTEEAVREILNQVGGHIYGYSADVIRFKAADESTRIQQMSQHIESVGQRPMMIMSVSPEGDHISPVDGFLQPFLDVKDTLNQAMLAHLGVAAEWMGPKSALAREKALYDQLLTRREGELRSQLDELGGKAVIR